MKDKKLKVEITELFMAEASMDRRFHGTIKRCCDAQGNPVVHGVIEINGGQIYASASDQKELGTKLDDMAKLILDADLHETDCVTAVNKMLTFENKRIHLN